MPTSRKIIKERKIAEERMAYMKKTPRKKNSSLLHQYKYDNYNTNKLQDRQSNSEEIQ